MEEAPTMSDLKYRKWDIIEKQIEVSEEKEEALKKEYG